MHNTSSSMLRSAVGIAHVLAVFVEEGKLNMADSKHTDSQFRQPDK